MENAKFGLFVGGVPGYSGRPMQVLARRTTQAIHEGDLKIAVVDPVMLGGAMGPYGEKAEWVPIKPATDGALVMGMLRWIMENNRMANDFLESPNLASARKVGYNSWTNATYLVIDDPSHPNHRKMLRPADLGWPAPAAAPGAAAPDLFVVIDKRSALPVRHTEAEAAQLFFDEKVVAADGKPIRVRTAMSILRESALKYSLDEYAAICDVPRSKIEELAREFTAHGHAVAIDGMGNTAAANAYHATMGFKILGTIMGSMNKKGGIIHTPPPYRSTSPGPLYDLTTWPNRKPVKGARISRDGMAYERTSEYKQKVARGENPYPSKLPWYGLNAGSDNQALFSMLNRYPYQAKIYINWFANILYATPSGGREAVLEAMKDPANIPLTISFDPYMGETTALMDYIIPDVTSYESWGSVHAIGAIYTRTSSLRWPVVEPMTTKSKDGKYGSIENFLIDVAIRLGMPGFGPNAIPGADGKVYPMMKSEDFWLKTVANIAYDVSPVPDISAEEKELMDLDRFARQYWDSIKPEEWPKVQYVLARGGRFEAYGQGFVGDNAKYPYVARSINYYWEPAALARNSTTGQIFEGTAGWHPETLHDGTPLDQIYPAAEWPFRLASYKPKLRSISLLVNSPIMRDLAKTNYVEMNTADADRLGLKNGDTVAVINPTGARATGPLLARDGVAPGTLGVSFGYGHWEYGARTYSINSQVFPGDPAKGTGIANNNLGLADPTFALYGYSDPATGIPGRNGGRFKVIKV